MPVTENLSMDKTLYHGDSTDDVVAERSPGGMRAALDSCTSSIRGFDVGAALYKLRDRFRLRRTKRHAKKILILNPAGRVKQNKRVNFRLPKSKQHRTFEPFEPDSIILRRWAHFMVIPLSYEIWAWPFRLAFGEAAFDAAITADVVFDCVFLVDMMRKCASVIPAGTLPDQDDPIKSFAGITQHYLGSQAFLRDIIPMVVYYLMLFIQWGSVDLNLWLFWAGTIPRIAMRAQRLRSYFKEQSRNLQVNAKMLEAVKFTMIIFFSSHWVGCFVFWLSRLWEHDETTWVHRFPDLVPLWSESTSPLAAQYLVCLYKGFDSMSNLSYVYGMPGNWIEMMWSLLTMAFQVYMSALILGSLLNYLVRSDPWDEAHKQRMDDLNAFAQARTMPPEMLSRLSAHFEYQYKCSAGKGMSIALPKSLTVKVVNHQYRSTIDKCTSAGKALAGCSKQFIDEFLIRLKVLHTEPGEELVKKDEIARELYLVVEGAVHMMDDDNRVVRVIRSDVPDMPPYAGLVPFFMGTCHTHSLRARPDGAVQLLVLGQKASDELFENFPSELEVIKANILASYGLDLEGRDQDGWMDGTGGAELDKRRSEVRASIQQALRTRSYLRSADYFTCAEVGDVDGVVLMLHKNVNVNSTNYDGQTALHVAAAKGHHKVVAELLNTEGVELNLHDRWGQTPYMAAMKQQQKLVLGLLEQRGAQLDVPKPADALCEAAYAGDLDTVRVLVESKVDPNLERCDRRTALHLACGQGHESVVDYLLRRKANVNYRDSMNSTPLKDAVLGGHNLLASILRSKGAILPEGSDDILCTAAGEGDIQVLQLLYECEQNLSAGDYDSRTALHLAAAEGRILAVSFLLSHTVDPNSEDRWGGRPLDDALRGRTSYHMYCGKLIQSWGGTSGTLTDTPEGQEAIKELEQYSVNDALNLVKRLLSKGFDRMKIKHQTEEELLEGYESSMRLVPLMCDVKKKGQRVARQVRRRFQGVSRVLRKLKSALKGMVDGLQSTHGAANDDDSKASKRALPQETSFHSDALQVLVTRTNELVEDEEKEGGDNEGMGEEALYSTLNGLSSDEEEVLHRETERMEVCQELINSTGKTSIRLASEAFQKVSLAVEDISDVLQILQAAFVRFKLAAMDEDDDASTIHLVTVRQLSQVLDWLGVQRDHEEVEKMFDEAAHFHEAQEEEIRRKEEDERKRLGRQAVKDKKKKEDGKGGGADGKGGKGKGGKDKKKDDKGKGKGKEKHLEPEVEEGEVPIRAVLAGSKLFRDKICSLPINEGVCQMMGSKLANVLEEEHCKKLVVSKEVHVQEGDLVFGEGSELGKEPKVEESNHARGSKHGVLSPVRRKNQKEQEEEPQATTWYIILDGSLKATDVQEGAEDAAERTLNVGDVFGAWNKLTGQESTFEIRADMPCTLLELPLDALVALLQEDHRLRNRVAGLMGEAMQQFEGTNRRANTMRSQSFKKITKALQRGVSTRAFQASFRQKFAWSTDNPDDANPAGLESLRNNAALLGSPMARGRQPKTLPERQRQRIVKALTAVDRLWSSISMGMGMASGPRIEMMGTELGEVGVATYTKLFSFTNLAAIVTEGEYWNCWLCVAAEDEENAEEEEEEAEPEVDPADLQDQESNFQDDAAESLFERLHARYAKVRSLKERFFDPAVIEHYESAYEHVTGDMKRSLPRSKVPQFLSQIFVDFPFPISTHNVDEFFSEFSKDGRSGKSVSWPEVRTVLRERRMGLQEKKGGFLRGSALNPEMRWVQWMAHLPRFCGAYYLVVVPVRAAFLPWDGMLDARALATDMPVDVLLTVSFVIALNTAYKNSRHAWIANRFKTLRKIHWAFIVAVVPLDWLAWVCGVDAEVAAFLRLLKLLLPLAPTPNASSSVAATRTVKAKILGMLNVVCLTLHFAACFWFFLGRAYYRWVEAPSVSWYRVHHDLADLTFERDQFYGWKPSSTVWDQYLLSLYWVSATLTVNGLVGDVIPQNLYEVGFTIILMLLNMTVYRWIIGEVSSIIMSAEMPKVRLREDYASMNDFIHGNQLPEELESEIKQQFHNSLDTVGNFQAKLFDGLSLRLLVDLTRFLFKETIENLALFEGCSESFVDAVCVVLTEQHFGPEETLFDMDTLATELYIVWSGEVDRVIPNGFGEFSDGASREGQTCGDMACFFGIKHLHTARANATVGAICLCLKRDHLFHLLRLFPDDEQKVAGNTIATFETTSVSMSSAQSANGKSVTGMSMASSGVQSTAHSSVASTHVSGSVAATSQHATSISADAESGGPDLGTVETGNEQRKKFGELKLRHGQSTIHILLKAAAEGDAERVMDTLQRQGGDINLTDSLHKRSALHVAAAEGQDHVVKALVDKNANLHLKDAHDNTAFNDAVRHERASVVDWLRKDKHEALQLSSLATARIMCRQAMMGDAAGIKGMVQNKASVNAVNADGRTALHVAACDGHVEVVRVLLDIGADAKVTDKWGTTPLQGAIRENRVEVQELLKAHEITLLGDSELEMAVKLCELAANNDLDDIKVLVAHGANVAAGDYDMRTPLHLAASNGRLAVLEYLMKLDPPLQLNPFDRFGGTPLEDAYRHNNKTVIKVLEANGGLRKDDPSQQGLLSSQMEKLKVERKAARQPVIHKAVEQSDELALQRYLEEDMGPGMERVGQELHEILARMLRNLQGVIDFVVDHAPPDSPSPPIRHNASARFNIIDKASSPPRRPDISAGEPAARMQSEFNVEGEEGGVRAEAELTAEGGEGEAGERAGLVVRVEEEEGQGEHQGLSQEALDAGWGPRAEEKGHGGDEKGSEGSKGGSEDGMSGASTKSAGAKSVLEGGRGHGTPDHESDTPKSLLEGEGDAAAAAARAAVASRKGGRRMMEEEEEEGDDDGHDGGDEADGEDGEEDGAEAGQREAAAAEEEFVEKIRLGRVLGEEPQAATEADSAEVVAPGGEEPTAFSSLERGAEAVMHDLAEMKTCIVALRGFTDPEAARSQISSKLEKEVWGRAWQIGTAQVWEEARVVRHQLAVCMKMYKVARRVLKELVRLQQRRARNRRGGSPLAQAARSGSPGQFQVASMAASVGLNSTGPGGASETIAE